MTIMTNMYLVVLDKPDIDYRYERFVEAMSANEARSLFTDLAKAEGWIEDESDIRRIEVDPIPLRTGEVRVLSF